MDNASVVRLVVLSAIWGASFLFMRVGAPVLSPALLIFFRVGLAAVFLLAVAAFLRRALEARVHWRHYLVLGLLNAALPFTLYAHAAKTLPASLLSVINATAPIWGTVVGALWHRTALTAKTLLGLLFGTSGVALLVGLESISLPQGSGGAIVCALAAALSYGIATTYTRTAKSVEPFANAHGTLWGATVLIIPALLITPLPAEIPSPSVIAAVVALGVLCSGVAYLLYFRLIADIGAAPALTVTFLIPVFGVLWGHLFLGEAVGWHTFTGAALILLGTALVTGFSFAAVLPARSPKRA